MSFGPYTFIFFTLPKVNVNLVFFLSNIDYLDWFESFVTFCLIRKFNNDQLPHKINRDIKLPLALFLLHNNPLFGFMRYFGLHRCCVSICRRYSYCVGVMLLCILGVGYKYWACCKVDIMQVKWKIFPNSNVYINELLHVIRKIHSLYRVSRAEAKITTWF